MTATRLTSHLIHGGYDIAKPKCSAVRLFHAFIQVSGQVRSNVDSCTEGIIRLKLMCVAVEDCGERMYVQGSDTSGTGTFCCQPTLNCFYQ